MKLATFVLLFVALTAHAGTDVGNGGDLVECRPIGGVLSGLYALDYVATLGPGDKPLVPDAQVLSFDQSLKRIQAQLNQKAPELGELFGAYLADLNNFTDWTQAHIWTPSGNPLIDVKDEKLLRTVPSNCNFLSPDPTALRLIQAVIRLQKPRVTQYQTDFKALEALKSAPLQYSYIIVHEWLRDFTDDAEPIRWANRLLHSTALEQLDSAGLRANLAGIGILMDRLGHDRICQRSDFMVSRIQDAMGKPCDSTTSAEVSALKFYDDGSYGDNYTLSFENRALSSLRYGDFESVNLRRLKLGSNSLTHVMGGNFAGLVRLSDLDLSENLLKETPRALFDFLPGLQVLRLRNNRIAALPPRFLAGAREITYLDLGRNQLHEVPEDLLNLPDPSHSDFNLTIDLSGNQLSTLPAALFARPLKGRKLRLMLGVNPISAAEVARIGKLAQAANIEVLF